MAAAYAALVSLTHILDQILHPPPTLQIIVDRDQIECLRGKVLLLLDFIENYSTRGNREIDDLETRIVDAAYAAEDIIEWDVMNQILERTAVCREEIWTLLCQGVQTAIRKLDSIEKELEKIKDKKGMEDLQHKNSTTETSSSRPLPSGKNTSMVGFQEHLIQVMSRLTTDESYRQIIPIVGMGGIGKTTLATSVYNNPFIMEHFHIRAWVTVSQEYTEKEILLGLLHQVNNTADRNEQEMNGDKLGEKLHKELFGRKYLIVMDDMWDIKAWDMVKRFLPDNDNGNRILVTTRQLKLAVDFGSCSPYKMTFLDEGQSWDLLREKIFAEEHCPVELEVSGKSIAKKCKGLPLALVVIGGLLAKTKREHWKYVEEDVTSVVNNHDDEFCMKILSLSYNHLPMYLKTCFLYLAVFPEDFNIQVSRLVRLWIAEGFIRKCKPKSLEEIGEEYLMDLIDRNLVLVGKRRINGEVKTCSIHDLFSDLCKREAQKHNFLLIAKPNNSNISPYMESVRRLSINGGKWKELTFTTSKLATTARSFLSFFSGNSTSYTASRFKLLRVLDMVDRYPKHEIVELINLRYVACNFKDWELTLSSISRFWSLQTLVVDEYLILPTEIWQMPQLRHVKARKISLPDPPNAEMDVQKTVVLENLQTLSTVKDFKCTEKVTKRIPNLKKLRIICHTARNTESFCLSNLGCLHKLESLGLAFTGTWGNVVFPSSLRKLTLSKCKIPWEDMSIVGMLPNLEVLKLQTYAAAGKKWISNAEEFVRLKFLLVHQCELEIWEADNTHFPCLEQLHLGNMSLKEIPADFAEILPLQVIDLNYCSNSLLTSAKEIAEQREYLGYDGLQVRNLFGLLKIRVKRGFNLDVSDHIIDPYVVVRMGKQRLKTRVIRKDINPEWNEDFVLYVSDPNHPVSLTVYDRHLIMDHKMGDAEFDIRPFIETLKMHPDNGLPNGMIITRILPARFNCLAEESSIVWKDGKVMQDMCLRLRNAECGEVKLQLQWIDLPDSSGL